MSKALVRAVLSTLYKVDDEEIAALLEKADDLPETSKGDTEIIKQITEKDKARVADFNTRAKKRFDDGYGKGKSETLSALERDLREEYDVDDKEEKLKGIELIRHIAVKQAEQAAEKGGKKADITDEAIKKSTLYLQLEKRLQTREQELIKEKDDAVKNIESTYKQKEADTVARDRAFSVLEGLNPVLSEDGEKAKRQKELFAKEVLSHKRGMAEDGTILLLDANGDPLKDDHGYTVKYDDFVKQLATQTFDFPTVKQKEAPANGKKPVNTPPKSNSTKVLPKPKNLEELTEVLEDRQYTVDERLQIQADFDKSH